MSLDVGALDIKSRAVLFCGLSRVLVKIADSLLSFTIPILVYQSTQSLAYSGLAYLIERLPRLLFFPVSGCLADRFGGRKTMILTDFLRGSICLLAFFITQIFPGFVPIWIPILGAGLALLNAQSMVALESLISRGLEKEEVGKAISFLQVADQMSLVLGPLLTVLASQYLSANYLLLFCCGLFGLSFIIVCLTRIQDLPTAVLAYREIPQHIVRGAQIVCQNSTLSIIALYSFFMNLLIGLLLASSAGLVTGFFGQKQSAYASLQLIAGLTSLLSLLFVTSSKVSAHLHLRRATLYFVVSAFGALIAACASNYYVFALAYTLLLAPAGFFNISSRTLRAQLLPSKERGIGTGFLLLAGQSGFPVAGFLLSQSYSAPQALHYFAWIAFLALGLAALCWVVFLSPSALKKQVKVETFT